MAKVTKCDNCNDMNCESYIKIGSKDFCNEDCVRTYYVDEFLEEHECRVCNGYGKSTESMGRENVTCTCSRCKGTGYILNE